MKLLFDTHLLLQAAGAGDRSVGALPAAARALIVDVANESMFSAASIWEVAIKHSLRRADFDADPHLLRRSLVDNGYQELPIDGGHAAAVATLPRLHKDPFDRILIAQATVEGIILLTLDAVVASYPGPIQKV